MAVQYHAAAAAIITLLLAVLVLTAGCASSPSSGSPATATATPQLQATVPPATAAATQEASSGFGIDRVVIRNFAFGPDSLTVPKGTTVTWLNGDSTPHTVVTDAGSPEAFSSPVLSTGGGFQFTFTVPGTYPYHCGIHPSMHGTIIVTP